MTLRGQPGYPSEISVISLVCTLYTPSPQSHRITSLASTCTWCLVLTVRLEVSFASWSLCSVLLLHLAQPPTTSGGAVANTRPCCSMQSESQSQSTSTNHITSAVTLVTPQCNPLRQWLGLHRPFDGATPRQTTATGRPALSADIATCGDRR